MKKSNLKTGMLVVFRDGDMAMVMKGMAGEDAFVGDGRADGRSWFPMKKLKDDLTYPNLSECDIVEVWSFGSNKYGASFRTDDGRSLLWRREDNIHKLKLNEQYEAVVDLKEKTVKVGCQTFDFKTVQALATITRKKSK